MITYKVPATGKYKVVPNYMSKKEKTDTADINKQITYRNVDADMQSFDS